jgi:DNA-binding CsgD family transcriptional regulator
LNPAGSTFHPANLEAFELDGFAEDFVIFALPLPDLPLIKSSACATLTVAERQVTRSLLVGDSNAAIAQGRGTAPRTVANQVSSVYRKLGVGNRAELYALFVAGRERGKGSAR